METIGVRELRQHASRYLARVSAGETLQIRDRGRPVARLVPPGSDSWEDLLSSRRLGDQLRAVITYGARMQSAAASLGIPTAAPA